LKGFFKDISVYGILPVIGKFAGFFLIPIYTRVFSSYEFGIVELLVTLASFLMFACNLEFYSAIGRFFYERDTLFNKRMLISTGLFLTLFFTVIVILLFLSLENIIIFKYLDAGDYQFEYKLALVWVFFSAIYTYLGILPRYDKKPKLYVLITGSSLLVRIGSTILYVLVFNAGIAGVIYGHITGSFLSTVLNAIVSGKYLRFMFSWEEAKEIMKFAFPLVPGLLLIGLWHPLSRSFISKFYSVETVGLLSFAVRITSVMAILNSAIQLAWKPLLFENLHKDSFKNDVVSISRIVVFATLYTSVILSLFSPEICLYIGTKEYYDSAVLIGFLSLTSSIEILTGIRGFGPLVTKKTYQLSMFDLIRVMFGLGILFLIKDKFGLFGIGLAFTLPAFIKYILLVSITSKKLDIKFHNKTEILLTMILALCIIAIFLSPRLLIRFTAFIVISLLFLTLFLKTDKLRLIKNLWN